MFRYTCIRSVGGEQQQLAAAYSAAACSLPSTVGLHRYIRYVVRCLQYAGVGTPVFSAQPQWHNTTHVSRTSKMSSDEESISGEEATSEEEEVEQPVVTKKKRKSKKKVRFPSVTRLPAHAAHCAVAHRRPFDWLFMTLGGSIAN